jgi:2'-hydroxyisoflavone reductase
MRLLILGGTSFVGRHLVLAARAAGLDVTLFNRGQTNAGLFSDVEQIHGDRDGGLSALGTPRWDAVLDVNGYVPRVVRQSVAALQSVYTYAFISSISVYDEPGPTGPDEFSAMQRLEEDTEEVTGETYGALKARCENVVLDGFRDVGLIVRPGLVVGPHDPTERFVRWIRRAADRGTVLAPGDPDRQVTFIDARDLADWVIRLLLIGADGTYNAVGPESWLSMGALLAACAAVTDGGPAFEWVPEEFLLDQGVAPWTDLPLWLPEDQNGLLSAPNDRARDAGLTFRSLEDTVRATWHWDAARADRGPAGLSREREQEVLAAWEQARDTFKETRNGE